MVSKVPYKRCSTICWLLRRRNQTWKLDNTIPIMTSSTPNRRVSQIKYEMVTFTCALPMNLQYWRIIPKCFPPSMKIWIHCVHSLQKYAYPSQRPPYKTDTCSMLLTPLPESVTVASNLGSLLTLSLYHPPVSPRIQRTFVPIIVAVEKNRMFRLLRGSIVNRTKYC